MEQLGKKANPQPIQPYSLSLLAGITKVKVMGIQLVEGGVDASVFDNFVYELLHIIRRDRRYDDRVVVIFMDNATIHRQEIVTKTVLGMKVFLLYTPQYSPQLNPVEKFFKYVKTKLRDQPSINK